MKNIAILIIVGLILFLVFGSKKDKTEPIVVPQSPVEQKLCYLYSQKNMNGLIDNAWLEMTIMGSSVRGQMNDIPAEKDSKKGRFEGITSTDDAGTITVWWNAEGEGQISKEELIVRFDSLSATIAYGEMKKNDDDSYSYADKSKLTYGYSMSKIDCDSLYEKNKVESHIRENAKTIITQSPVLGGSWYITVIEVDTNANVASIEYEDGHIAGKGTVTYTYEGGEIKSTTFTKK